MMKRKSDMESEREKNEDNQKKRIERKTSEGERDCGAWWLTGRFVAFSPKGRGFESRYGRRVGTLGKSFTRNYLWRFGVKLRHWIS